MSAATVTQKSKPLSVPAKPDDDQVLGKAYDPHITRRLLEYVRPYQKRILIALVWQTVSMTAYIVGPYLIKVALDSGIAAKNFGVLAQVVGLFLLAAGVQWVGTYLRVRIMAVVGQSIIYDMRRQLFEHIQSLSLGFFSRYAVGRLISRVINDVGVLREMITWAVLAVFRDFFDLFGTTLAMFLLNWQLTLLSFLVLPLMGIATEIFRRRARQSYRTVRSAVGWVNAVLNENIVGVRVVQSFSREDYNYEVFAREVNGNLLKATNRASLLISRFSSNSACVPSSMMRPLSITTILSARVIVDKRCAMTNDVRPLNNRSSADWMTRSVWVSTLDVASSRIRTRGSASNARANEMSCFCPPDKIAPPSPTNVS